MTRHRTVLLVRLAVLLVVLLGCAQAGPTVTGTGGAPAGSERLEVVRHTDGDTLRVRLLRSGAVGTAGEEVAVRLLEIDTPELFGDVEECHAQEAADALAELLPVGSEVWGEPDRELRDPYGRTLLYLWLDRGADTVLVNEALVRRGLARAVLYEPNDRRITQIRAAERSARDAGRGLWGACPAFGSPD